MILLLASIQPPVTRNSVSANVNLIVETGNVDLTAAVASAGFVPATLNVTQDCAFVNTFPVEALAADLRRSAIRVFVADPTALTGFVEVMDAAAVVAPAEATRSVLTEYVNAPTRFAVPSVAPLAKSATLEVAANPSVTERTADQTPVAASVVHALLH